MRNHQVKAVYEYIIAEYFLSADLLSKPVDIEVRYDNEKQFNSHLIINFFKENYLNQVITHPCTPEENVHIESFHNTIDKALKRDQFRDLEKLEHRLKSFYTGYNNNRSHSSLKGVAPAKF